MINFIDDVVIAKDPAGQELSRSRAEKTVKAALFQTPPQATEIARRYLAANGWPAKQIQLPVKRSQFRLQPGDPFVYSSVRYGITGVVYRVATVSEEGLESGNITINAVLDYRYISTTPLQVITNEIVPPVVVKILDALTEVRVLERPYPGTGTEDMYLVPLAGRESENMTGYRIYTSLDGVTYALSGVSTSFAVVGELTAEYTEDTYEIDDITGIYLTIAIDASYIQSISRAQMFGLMNLAMLGDELISFQTITPTGVTNEYHLTGVIRNRQDTERDTHAVGTKLYWMGRGAPSVLMDSSLIGVTRWVKLVPYNAKRSGLLEDATPLEITIAGRARKPYRPTNLKANGTGINPYYSTDVALTWQPRLRTEGAGFSDADNVTDASPTWEGYFRVKVYVGTVLKRTTSAINALTWTYTEAMNLEDNTSLADVVTFRLTNYRTLSGIEYESAYTELVVEEEV